MLSIRDLRELLEDSREDILGIDLAGSPRRDTGVAYFKGNELMSTFYTLMKRFSLWVPDSGMYL